MSLKIRKDIKHFIVNFCLLLKYSDLINNISSL